MALDITKIIQDNLPENCYNKSEVKKIAIVIHHTESNGNPHNVINGWRKKADKVCTPFVIAGYEDGSKTYKDGDIVQAFSSKYGSYHLGLKNSDFAPFRLPYKELNFSSVPIELCNWGTLKKNAQGAFSDETGKIIPDNQVYTFDPPFRGVSYFQKYTPAQIVNLRDLLVYLCDKYGIPKTYNGNIWEANKDALSGKSGIWSHVSYRSQASGKWDCSPQPELITMLKSL